MEKNLRMWGRVPLLVQCNGIAEFDCLAGTASGDIKGEMELEFTRADVPGTKIGLRSFGFVCPGVIAGPEGQLSGKLSVSASPGEAPFLIDDSEDFAAFEMQVSARLFCAALSEQRVRRKVDHTYFPNLECTSGLMHGRFEISGGELLFSGKVVLSTQEVDRRWINSIVFSWSRVRVRFLGSPLAECPAQKRVFRQRLRLQPISFSLREKDPKPTGRNRKMQIDKAKEVWKKCCVDIVELAPVIVVDASRKASDQPEFVAAGVNSSELNVVEVFFVDNPLTRHNGSSTVDAGVVGAKIVITDDNASEPCLLAHELGHVLNGRHPGESVFSPEWEGDAGTVMQPISFYSRHIPDKHTFSNCSRINNREILIRLEEGCCLDMDTIPSKALLFSWLKALFQIRKGRV